MKAARKLICVLVMVTVLCAMLATAAFAAEDGNMWLQTGEGEDGKPVVTIVADTTVTNGQVELRYDAKKLTYADVTVSEEFVDVYAVNTDTPGVIKIAWVAPGAYTTEGDTALIQVSFTGKLGAKAVSISGDAYDAEGNPVTMTVKEDDSSADTGDSIAPIMGLMLLSAAAMAVCVVCNKKGWWVK